MCLWELKREDRTGGRGEDDEACPVVFDELSHAGMERRDDTVRGGSESGRGN